MTSAFAALKCPSGAIRRAIEARDVILAGIDEAGYGPRLGPLVVAANAFRTTREKLDGWPECRFLRGRGPLRVADSKALYSTGRGLARLEEAVLAFAAHGGCAGADPGEFFERWAADGALEARKRPWYAFSPGAMPVAGSPGTVDRLVAEVALKLGEAGLEYLGAVLSIVDESRFNDMVRRTDNKSLVLFGRAGVLMKRLWDLYGGEGIFLTVDRQGGRKFYAGLLDVVFPHERISILSQNDTESVYRVSGNGREMHVRFAVRAEELDSSVALSSMWAKYTREVFMGAFNDYWLARAGDIAPTAGYWVDAERFLAELAASGAASPDEIESLIRWK